MQIYIKNKTSYREFIVALGAGILLGLIHCLINFDNPPQKLLLLPFQMRKPVQKSKLISPGS